MVMIALLAAGKSVLCFLARIVACMLVELVVEVEVEAAANFFDVCLWLGSDCLVMLDYA